MIRYHDQALSKDLEYGYLKLAIVNIFGILFFLGDITIHSEFTPSDMYFLIEEMHNSFMQYCGNCIKVEIFNYMLEIGI